MSSGVEALMQFFHLYFEGLISSVHSIEKGTGVRNGLKRTFGVKPTALKGYFFNLQLKLYRVDTSYFCWLMIYKSFSGCFSDKRLDQRCARITKSLFAKGTHSIRQLTDTSAGSKGFYRFLQNDNTDEKTLVSDMSARCGTACAGKTVLCFQDTSDVNLYNHRNRLKDDGSVGLTSSDRGIGFLLHPSLAVDAATCMPYGFAHVRIWNRPMGKQLKSERRYKTVPMEQRESYKWIETSVKTKEALCQAASVVIIQDWEGDIYEQFAQIPDGNTHLLVRSRFDRPLKNGGHLYDSPDGQPAQASYTLTIAGDKRKNRAKREARIEVRFRQVEILRPGGSAKNMPASLRLCLIEAREVGADPSKVANPVCWRLLTTLDVMDEAAALACVEWYSWRWMIEEVFRILKKEGFDIEASELEYGGSIRKLCLLMLDTIIKLFMMQIAYAVPEEEGLPAAACLTTEERQCLDAASPTLEGKTVKQKNPFKKGSLKNYVWVIARLGGWKGYKSETAPGITTLWLGLKELGSISKGWKLARDVSTR